MPAAYAHLSFGDKVLALLPEHLKVMISGSPRCQALYNLGVQGPDFFYFYHLYHPFNSVISIGIRLHHSPAAPFFENARELLKKDFDPELYSYVLGFITHFMLDSSCHPYILARMKKAGSTHHEIESEFDRMLMIMDSKDPFSHNPAAYCDTSVYSSKVISKLFPEASPEKIRSAVMMMKFSRGILKCRWAPQRAVLYNLSRLFQVKGMVLTESVRPDCIMSNKELYAIYEKAAPETAKLITGYDNMLFTDEPLDERFWRNYETLRKYKRT